MINAITCKFVDTIVHFLNELQYKNNFRIYRMPYRNSKIFKIILLSYEVMIMNVSDIKIVSVDDCI